MTRKQDRTSDEERSDSLERLRELTRRIVQVPKEEVPVHKAVRRKGKKKKKH